MLTTKMTKIGAVVAASFMIVSVANAATPGAYAGIGLGASKIDAASKSMFTNTTLNSANASNTSGGLGGKVFGGYNFNSYFGLEANFAEYARTTNKMIVGNNSASAKYNMSALSLVAKGYLPVQKDFNLFALGGAAEVFNKANYSNNSNGAIVVNNNLKMGSQTFHKLRPILGVGASYDVNSQVTTGLEFSRIIGNGNVNTNAKAVPSANMLTLTGAYNFG